MDNYEPRESQLAMMRACCKSLEDGGMLLAEAGTGTGKTFAYLIPIILSGRRAIISTRTINLQEQLVSKDLRFLSGLTEFDYAIAKGRSNYLCLRRLNAFRPLDDKDGEEYASLARWASGKTSGDIEDLGRRNIFIWDRVCCDADACRGMKCEYFRQCFYFAARQKWARAQIVVANHALVGINALLPEDGKILPEAEVLVIDEAHALDGILSDVAGVTLSNRGFERIVNRLLKTDERGIYRGLLAQTPMLFPLVEALRADMNYLWMSVKNGMRHRAAIRGAFPFKPHMSGLLESTLLLIDKIKVNTAGLFQEDDELELKAAVLKLRAFAEGMEALMSEPVDFVRWAETEDRRVALRMSPVYPRNFVQESLLPQHGAVVFTSATLSVSGDFGFITKVLGLQGANTITVPSPFDLRTQVTVDIRRGIDPKSPDNAEKLSRVIVEEAARLEGGVLVLFTSRDVMNRTWKLAVEDLSALGLNPMMQGELPNRVMLEVMRDSLNSVLFGLDSFWEGVDVKGDALKSLIIVKLPFEVPTEPVVQARTEEIERNGGNAFGEYSLPCAVLKFKQGFGRLIRSKTDRGRVVICDERIETKSYGRKFLEAVYRQ